MMETPGALEIPFYERVHGSAPTPLPGLPDVLRLLWAMDIHPDVAMLTAETAILDTDRDAAMEQLRRRLGVSEGTAADDRLRAAADGTLGGHAGGLHGQGRVAETDGDCHLVSGAQRRVAMPRNDDVTGIVLAGGAGRRMGRAQAASSPWRQDARRARGRGHRAARCRRDRCHQRRGGHSLPWSAHGRRRRARSRSGSWACTAASSPVRHPSPSSSRATPPSSRPRFWRRSSHAADPTP